MACGGTGLRGGRPAEPPKRRDPLAVDRLPATTGRRDVGAWQARARGIRLHRSTVHPEERSVRHGIPVTSVAQTLFDLAELSPARQFRRAYEEADRLNLLRPDALERVCQEAQGRRGLAVIGPLVAAERGGATRSALEDLFVALCEKHGLPTPEINQRLHGFEVDALWPQQRLIAELDGFAYHRHRAAFERDRARDSALQAAGYRVVRYTHRRLEREPDVVATELRALLGEVR